MKKGLLKILTIVFIVTIIFALNTISKATEINVTVSTQEFPYASARQATATRRVFNVGETVVFKVDWEANMQATGFKLAYSKDGLEFKGASIGENFYSVDEENGKISVEWAALDEVDKTFIEFNFEVKAVGSYSLEVERVTAFANGNLEVPETYNLTNNSSVINAVIMGDVNDDGEVTEDDATLLQLYLMQERNENELNLTNADVNIDGVVNFIDVQLISKKASGQINSLPVIYGDLDGDGQCSNLDRVMVSRYLDPNYDIELNAQQLVCADVVCDGVIDDYDTLLMSYTSARWDDFDKHWPAVYGDLNGDGNVTSDDLEMLLDMLDDETVIQYSSDEYKQLVERLADVNLDGVVNSIDFSLVQAFLDLEIPYLPISMDQPESLAVRLNEIIDQLNNKVYSGIQILREGITKTSFINEYVTNPQNVPIELKNYNGQTILDDGFVGTGTTIYATVDAEPEVIGRLLIYGDCNGDGLIDAVDALALIKHMNNKITFTNDLFARAGKVINTNYEGLTAVDALAIVKHANNKYVINQNIDQ